MPEAPAPAFTGWLNDFFASYFRRRPVNATFTGMHDFDDRLPDLSEGGLADLLADTENLLGRLQTLPDETLSSAQLLDRQLAEGFLLIQRWECSSTHFGLNNPTLFTGEAIFGTISLLLHSGADSAISRLEEVPSFLGHGMRITRAPAAWIARARQECHGAGLLLQHLRREPAVTAASEAFARFADHLEHDVVATHDYAAGGEAIDLLLRKAHFLPGDASALERLALDRIAEEESFLGATPPPADQPPENEPGDYLSRFHTLWNAARDLARDHELLTFPIWPVRFVDRPIWAREAAPYLYFLPYRSPPPLDSPPVVEYLTPPGADASTIKLNHVVHHASLGHHVQNWYAARAESRIGQVAAVDCASRIAMLCGGTMAEGWANYAVDLAEEAGFLTPPEEYSQHRARLRMAARTIVDLRLHDGRFNLEQAIGFYAQRVGMPESAARAEAVKNSLFPGAACMYLAGWDALHALRRAVASRRGGAFSLRAFHDEVLSFGSIPVSLSAKEMLQCVDANSCSGQLAS